MRIMKSYDYDCFRDLVKDNPYFWLRTSKGEKFFYSEGERIALPKVKEDNLQACKKYAEINRNFAYKYDSSSHTIIVWDKTIEEFCKVSALQFQEVDTCGMGLMAYNKSYPQELEGEIPTARMLTAAESISFDFLEFKHH